jgi:hypothetical protein
MIAEMVYVLCAATSLVCALLLGRGYRRTRQRLLLWSTLCFAGLFINNVFTFIDLVIITDYDLHWVRSTAGFAPVALLAIGLLWDVP